MRSRSEAIGLVQYVVDDALSARPLGADPHAIIRTSEMMRFKYESAIVVCECESGTIGVVVHSYLDTRMEEDESVDLAVDYLQEIGETVVETEFHPGDECSTPRHVGRTTGQTGFTGDLRWRRTRCTRRHPAKGENDKMTFKPGIGRAGHQPHWTGTGAHDNRPRRRRQRGQANRAAIKDQM